MSARVLIVDDEPFVVQGIVRLIGRDFNIETATSGREALDLLSCGDFQVIMTDMRMPGMSGLELLDQVQQKYPRVVRMMLTGFDEQQVAFTAVEKNQIFHFLTKPCDKATLITAIKSAVDLYQLHVKIEQISTFIVPQAEAS